jgi:hypothetical protein
MGLVPCQWFSFDLNTASFLVAIQHLLQPRSNLGFYQRQQRYLPEIELNHLYRSLDILAEYKETLEQDLFAKNRNLFNMKVDVVFFDVATFSFESVRAHMALRKESYRSVIGVIILRGNLPTKSLLTTTQGRSFRIFAPFIWSSSTSQIWPLFIIRFYLPQISICKLC